MIFNKKILGSCCVGLALLLSSEGFGMQREYTLAHGGQEVRMATDEDSFSSDSSEGFGMQREYTLAQDGKEVKITSAEIRAGVERFSALPEATKLREELSSYWDVFISAYLVAQRGIPVGSITESTAVEEIVKMNGYDVFNCLCNILGGDELFFAVYEGVRRRMKTLSPRIA